ncbi:virulence factor [Kiloniella antarctica]|uniref:Virulence factor n=1 Tax=Kiloniella antarctica TaxID=1550907 RepID=A0ABW5BK69_9PROT
MAKLTIVYWRDIPAQIIVKAGRKNAKIQLTERFEKAIDRAAMKAKLRDSDSYLEHWRRSDPVTCGDDLEAEANETASKIEQEYTDEKLDILVSNGGLSNAS